MNQNYPIPRCNHNHDPRQPVNLLRHHPPLPDRIRSQLENLQAIRYPTSAFLHHNRRDPFAVPANHPHEEDGAFPPFIFNHPPPTSKPRRAKKNGPRMGLTRVFDPRNHPRSPIPAPCLPTVPIIYVQVRVRTRPRRRRRDLAATCAPLRITW